MTVSAQQRAENEPWLPAAICNHLHPVSTLCIALVAQDAFAWSLGFYPWTACEPLKSFAAIQAHQESVERHLGVQVGHGRGDLAGSPQDGAHIGTAGQQGAGLPEGPPVDRNLQRDLPKGDIKHICAYNTSTDAPYHRASQVTQPASASQLLT